MKAAELWNRSSEAAKSTTNQLEALPLSSRASQRFYQTKALKPEYEEVIKKIKGKAEGVAL